MAEEVQNNAGQPMPHQTIIINQPEVKQMNGIGVAGFVLALVTLIFCWLPIFNWVTWALGLIFSCIGMTKQPKGLAIAGLVISLIGVIVIIFVMAAIGTAVSVATTNMPRPY